MRLVAGGDGETRCPGTGDTPALPSAIACSLLGRSFTRSEPVRESSFIPIRGPRTSNKVKWRQVVGPHQTLASACSAKAFSIADLV
jgi:hypothetical protein